MLKNYIKIAWRSLLRYKFTSFINLFGLSVGITCCLLIMLYVLDEVRYDRYNSHAEQVYRVERTFLNPEDKSISLSLGAVAPPIGPLLQNDFKEIQALTSILPIGGMTLQYQDKIFNEEHVYCADENLFKVFDFTVTKGDPKTALNEPYSVMLTEEMAKKYFGEENPVNKLLTFNQQLVGTVTGVYKALPANAHWHPNIMISFSTLRDTAIYGEEQLRTNWGNNAFYNYILLPKDYDAKKLEAQFPAFLNRHIPNSDNKAQEWTSLSLRKLTDIHLRSHKDSELEENGDIKRVYIFTIIGLFILLIACINYMNLSTARSALRAKEIGIRKVVGAEKRELVYQFLSESILLCFLATAISILITGLTLAGLNSVSGKQLPIQQLIQPQILIPIVLLPLLIGSLSGLYPALFLSEFKPIKVLKGIVKSGKKTLSLRKALVVFQFTVSIALIISTIIVFRQLDYIQHKSLGFNKEQIVILNNNEALKNSFPAFKTAVLDNPSIKSVGRSSRIPSGRLLDDQVAQINLGNNLAPAKADIKYVRVDEGFIPTYSIPIKAGRNFNRTDGTDTLSFIINEAAVKALGLKSNEEAIGKQFQYGRIGQIVGVMNDFNFESLHQRIIPLVMFNSAERNDYGRISIKITGSIPQALKHIQSTWEKFMPETPFDYTFLDDRFTDLYKAEHKQQIIFTLFSGIAIAIACLGLLGLSAFTITQRIKEIGIRKVLGASMTSIVSLLSKDFLLLVAFAAIIAFPITWFAMSNWLNDFAYRIDLSWWVFVLATAIALLIAFVTISIQTIKAARANPVKSLRSE
ncbi:ABC transporter permease [Olivibacter sp. XZL3]|uniref:ABC transporter permease n=1 Tax=Olivibacter sp. XZL3 TaxID=1735116 RepID=UPI001065A486|nr:ABC transporter permease [Olivibacter sp. XZL3]